MAEASDPTPDADDVAAPAIPWMEAYGTDDEGLFARSFDGQLIRVTDPTSHEYDDTVTIKIDGQEVTVSRASPLRDAQGNIVRNEKGETIPRATTIYDAASELFVRGPEDENPIPILCHREHLQPVGVCRLCMVEVHRTVDGKRQGRSQLVASCCHRVEPGMEVQTIESRNEPAAGERLRKRIRTLTELLVADHLQSEGSTPNELQRLADRLEVDRSRFSPREHDRGVDESSARIVVDHNNCILCDRCVRACSDVKQNYVIGRTGKGYTARVGFDLDDPMGESSCVSCGECMISCPTDALTFATKVDRDLPPGQTSISAEELAKIPLFSGVPHKYLQWNSGSVARQKLKAGDVLCNEGEFGREAFLLIDGKFSVTNQSVVGSVSKKSEARGGWFGRISNVLAPDRSTPDELRGAAAGQYAGAEGITLTPDDVIVGEMTCMNHYPRSATVTAATDAEVLRIGRDVLFMLQRNRVARELLDDVYRRRVLDNQLGAVSLLQHLTPEERAECIDFLRDKIELLAVDPGQVVFRQGERASDLYMVRLGFVRVSQGHADHERVRAYLGPGSHFGEIGIISELADELAGVLAPGQVGRRTATVTALDHVELAVIRGEHFRELLKRAPAIKAPLAETAKELVIADTSANETVATPLAEFLTRGLYHANKLLVLDLEACTRCDECTKACSDTHQGVTRLIRDGLRFDKWLVAGSCRSCLDPYCLVGCPVDAIHREGSLEIRIEDHCIGCGLCANNCPYGNINMHGFEVAGGENRSRAVIQQRATTCDQCRDVVPEGQDPSCVYACPHNAAFRMSGTDLLDTLQPNQSDG